ncbi:MAG: hypothetical protein JJ858_13545 [Rhizobiaceae bacterium]|nr:hypothetical protein [Rhizobiaceae bacterium]
MKSIAKLTLGFFVSVIVSIGFWTAQAAEITDTGEGLTSINGCSFSIDGVIKTGDADIFEKILKEFLFEPSGGGKNYVVCFSGTDGDVSEALKIAEILIKFQLVSSTAEGEICADACAIAFLGGRDCCIEFGLPMGKRHLANGSELRFRAPSLDVVDGVYEKTAVERAFSQALDIITELQKKQAELKIDGSLITNIVRNVGSEYFSVKPDPKYRYNYFGGDGGVYQEIWEPDTNERLAAVPHDSPIDVASLGGLLELQHFNEHNIELVGTSGNVYISNYARENRSAIVDLEDPSRVRFYPTSRLWHAKGASTHLSRDGSLLVSIVSLALPKEGSDGLHAFGYIFVSTTETTNEKWRLPLGQSTSTVATISPDNKYIAATLLDDGESDRQQLFKIGLFEIGAEVPIGTFYGHDNHASSLIFSTDGKFLISGSTDGWTRVWDVETQELISEFNGTSKGASYTSISPDNELFVTATKGVKVWNLLSGELVRELPYEADVAQFLPDGENLLLSGGYQQNIKIVNLKSNEIVLELADTESPRGAVILPNSKQLVYSHRANIKIVDLPN